jgi:hypothetical protein
LIFFIYFFLIWQLEEDVIHVGLMICELMKN